MTITTLTDTHVTIGGQTYEYPRDVAYLLRVAHERGHEVEVVVVDGRIVRVGFTAGKVLHVAEKNGWRMEKNSVRVHDLSVHLAQRATGDEIVTEFDVVVCAGDRDKGEAREIARFTFPVAAVKSRLAGPECGE